MPRLRPSAFHIAILAGVSILLYLPTLKADFIWDDISYVKKNTLVRQWRQIPLSFYDRAPSSGGAVAPIYRPIRNVSYIVDYQLWGLDPAGYHLQNIFWHAIVVLLVYFITRELCGSAMAALLGALLFASHPVLTESVAWIKGRDALLSAAFGLGACLVYLRALRRSAAFNSRAGWGWVAAMLALFAFSIFSYPSAVVFPAAFMLLHMMFPARGNGAHPADGANQAAGASSSGAFKSWFPARAAIIGSFAIAFLFLVVRRIVIGQTAQGAYLAGGSFAKTMISMLPVAYEYFRLLVFPLRLNADYIAYPHYQSLLAGPVLLGGAVIAGYLLAAWLCWRRGAKLALFALIWMPLFLAPVSNVIPTMQLLAERFLYLPAVALSFLAASAWMALENRPRRWARYLGIAVVGMIVAAFCARAYARLAVWQNETAFYEATWRADRNNLRAMGNYGEALFNQKRYKEAIETLENLHKKTGQMEPKTRRALALSHAGLGDRARAIQIMEEGLKSDPQSGLLNIGIALLASESGQRDRARQAIGQIKGIEQLDTQNRFLLGVVYMNLEMYAQAEETLSKLEPEWPAQDANFLRNIARSAYHQEKWRMAREYYTRILRLAPGDEEARSLLPDLDERIQSSPFGAP
ncbi:MAG: hypothetical protein NTX50_04655 [Candidatus Sumerlaeota bacterium]|nr:hypothetical protein [Candidatus Sumerlaeota bacterium]